MKVWNAAIFDLDGVVVDTAKYHFLAWRQLAETLGFVFTEQDNERLKGVSRMESLEILLEVGNRKNIPYEEKLKLANQKNEWYKEYLYQMTPAEILPGVKEFMQYLKLKNLKTALASASKNAPIILSILNIANFFDVIIDGTCVSKAKPDPEVFFRAAEALAIPPDECLVFEDAQAGVEGAQKAGMRVVGIGKPEILHNADVVINGFSVMESAALFRHIESQIITAG